MARYVSRPVMKRPPDPKTMAAAVAVSVAPDLDVLPGLIMGDISAFHNQAAHSPLFGLIVCAALAGIARRFLNVGFCRTAVFMALCYGMHLAIDGMTVGRGLKLLWPFSEARFASPIPLFYGVRHSEGWWSLHHAVTGVTELASVAVAFAIAGFLEHRRRQSNADARGEASKSDV